jgi:mono/diheme cytochrome c family protein
LAVLAAVVVSTIYFGFYDVAADEPHWSMTEGVVGTLRDRSIRRAAKDVATPPALEDRKRIANGASEYAEMCTSCHLAPGMKDTEMRQGLYPQPPDFTQHGTHRSPAEQFWIIKHGLKMTGMPAWGLTHDDERLWSMVAFLRQLPGMTPVQYRQLTASGEGGHHHGENAEGATGDHHGTSTATPEKSPADKPAEHPHDHGAHDHGTGKAAPPMSGDAAEAAAVVDQFQKRVAQGRTKEAEALLDPGLLVFEGGDAERSRAEYASHHLESDAEFLRSATVAQLMRRGQVDGDTAWIATESELRAAGPKPTNLLTTETMVLKRTPQGWLITHIHWSSKARK